MIKIPKKNKMKKLTTEQKNKVKKFIKNLKNIKINESSNINLQSLYDASSDYFEVINQFVGNTKIKDSELREDIENTHSAVSMLIGTLEVYLDK